MEPIWHPGLRGRVPKAKRCCDRIAHPSALTQRTAGSGYMLTPSPVSRAPYGTVRCGVKSRRPMRCPVVARTREDHSAQLRVTQLGVTEIGVSEVCSCQVCVAKLCL